MKKATYNMIVDSIDDSIDVEMCGQDKFTGACPFHTDKESDAEIVFDMANYSYECKSCGSCGSFYNSVLSLNITDEMQYELMTADVMHQVLETTTGTVNALLRHCVIASIDDRSVGLILDEEQCPLLTLKIAFIIRACFGRVMGKDITLSIKTSYGEILCQ